MRILFLTAGFGEGHNAAARALAAAAEAAHGYGPVVDVFAVARPRLNRLVRQGYLGLINRAPQVWSSVYRRLDETPDPGRINRWLGRERRRLAEVIAAEKPDAICSTYPVYAYLIEALRAQGHVLPPHFDVVTDSISINSIWWRADCAGWFVPNEDSAVKMRDAGVDPARVHVMGFPVARFFAENQGRLTPPDLAAHSAPRVLCIINSVTRGSGEVARRLLTETDWDVTCTVGRNDALKAALLRAAEGRTRPAAILGWTNEIPRLLMTHHVVVSKAGGATTQEAIAARCPMLVNQIVPGQEEGNYELLRRRGIGGLAQTPEEVVAALRHAFADGGQVWRSWRSAIEPLARPTAAADIVAAMAEAVSSRRAEGAGETLSALARRDVA